MGELAANEIIVADVQEVGQAAKEALNRVQHGNYSLRLANCSLSCLGTCLMIRRSCAASYSMLEPSRCESKLIETPPARPVNRRNWLMVR